MSQTSTGFSRCEIKSPTGGRRLLSFRDLKELKGIKFSRQWLDKLIAQGKFPKPIRPGGGAHKAWIEHEVDQHIDDCAAARDGAT
jgi:predicted DNA-binding transcriptional regulator AlpA